MFIVGVNQKIKEKNIWNMMEVNKLEATHLAGHIGGLLEAAPPHAGALHLPKTSAVSAFARHLAKTSHSLTHSLAIVYI